jgi:hypothetical protein
VGSKKHFTHPFGEVGSKRYITFIHTLHLLAVGSKRTSTFGKVGLKKQLHIIWLNIV